MNDSSNICLSCGLCCDGTLIGFVQLEQKEVPALSKIMNIEKGSKESIFLHSCEKFCDGCTIYASRPKNCIKFKCGLLKSLEAKTTTFDAAIDTIELAKKKRSAIEEQITSLNLNLKSQSFYFKMVELNKLLQSPKYKPLTAEHHNIINSYKELEELVINKFNLSYS